MVTGVYTDTGVPGTSFEGQTLLSVRTVRSELLLRGSCHIPHVPRGSSVGDG